MALGVDSASNRNEYQEYFLGGKGSRCVVLTTLPPSCAVVVKSRSLNLLVPYDSLQACNGIALPLTQFTVCYVAAFYSLWSVIFGCICYL